MIDLGNLFLFLAASWLLILTPGPDMLYVLARGVGQGRAAGVVSALGVATGILAHTLFAALGLSMVLRTSALAFTLVKFVGAGYLVFLGLKALMGKNSLQPGARPARRSLRAYFLQGLATDVLNPKMALFFLAFLPQFVSAGQHDAGLQMLLLGAIYALCSTIFLVLVSLGSGFLGAWLGKRKRTADALGRLTGCVFIGLGLKLALGEQSSR